MKLLCLSICLFVVGCSSFRVRCDARLRPINPPQSGPSHAQRAIVGELAQP